jgi:hypothetical protein
VWGRSFQYFCLIPAKLTSPQKILMGPKNKLEIMI